MSFHDVYDAAQPHMGYLNGWWYHHPHPKVLPQSLDEPMIEKLKACAQFALDQSSNESDTQLKNQLIECATKDWNSIRLRMLKRRAQPVEEEKVQPRLRHGSMVENLYINGPREKAPEVMIVDGKIVITHYHRDYRQGRMTSRVVDAATRRLTRCCQFLREAQEKLRVIPHSKEMLEEDDQMLERVREYAEPYTVSELELEPERKKARIESEAPTITSLSNVHIFPVPLQVSFKGKVFIIKQKEDVFNPSSARGEFTIKDGKLSIFHAHASGDFRVEHCLENHASHFCNQDDPLLALIQETDRQMREYEYNNN